MANKNPKLNIQNLKPLNTLTKEEAREIQRKGGLARQQKAQEKKTMQAVLDYLLEKEIPNKKGLLVSYREAILTACIKKAIEGDVKAAQFVRDTAGEVPVVKTELTGKDGLPLVQKVFVTSEDIAEVDEEIDRLINE